MLFNQFEINEDEYKIIPITWNPTKHYSISFEGWAPYQFDANDDTLSFLTKLSSKFIEEFINHYEKTHAFSQPMFCIKTDGTFIMKIATMEIDHYDELKKKYK